MGEREGVRARVRIRSGERPAIAGVHHLKLAVADLDRAASFYALVFGAERIKQADHHRADTGELYAYILEVPGLGAMLELRLDPAQAERHRGFDPVTIAVRDRGALDEWSAYLDRSGIEHSPVITAIQSWVLVLEDPDGHRLRLYSLQKHGPELPPDEDNPWL